MSAVCPLNHLQFSSFGSPTSSLEHQLSSSSSTNSLILPHHRRSSMNDIHCEFSANKMAAPRSFSTSSSMLEYPRFHTRRNAVQYSPAQLRSALQSAPMPLSVPVPVPVPVPCAVSDSTQAFSLPSKHNNSHGLTIQVPPIVRAMSAEDKSSRQRRRNRFRPSQQRHRSSAAPTASPRLPPAPPSSPILRSPFVSASPSPHLIPSPPSALCRPPPNSPSIFSFQALSPALQQLRTRHRVQRSSSVPELFLGVSTASSFAWDSEETKAETEMSPKASGLRFERIMDGIEFGRLLQQVEENVEPQEEKYNLQAVNAGKVQRLNVHTPRVSSSYNSGYSNVPSPSRTMVTSPPLQAVLYSHLQHLNNRLELEEKEAEPEKNALEQAKEPHGRRERRNGIFYSCADSQQLREDLAAMIRQQQNPLFLFAALPNPSNSPPAIRATHRRRPAMLNPPQFDAHIPFPEDWMQTACDVSECEAENEADIEEAVEFSSVASPASNHSSSPHADRE